MNLIGVLVSLLKSHLKMSVLQQRPHWGDAWWVSLLPCQPVSSGDVSRCWVVVLLLLLSMSWERIPHEPHTSLISQMPNVPSRKIR